MPLERWLQILRLRLRSLVRAPQLDRDLDDELRYHVEQQTDANVARGMSRAEAHRQALLEFGGVMQTKETVRDLGVWSIVNGLVQDVRLAFRSLRATPIV